MNTLTSEVLQLVAKCCMELAICTSVLWMTQKCQDLNFSLTVESYCWIAVLTTTRWMWRAHCLTLKILVV